MRITPRSEVQLQKLIVAQLFKEPPHIYTITGFTNTYVCQSLDPGQNVQKSHNPVTTTYAQYEPRISYFSACISLNLLSGWELVKITQWEPS